MADPAPSIIERLRGKRTKDIALPNETGEIDSRLSPSKDQKDRAAQESRTAQRKQLLGSRSLSGRR